MADMPSLDEALAMLADISESESELTASTKLADTELDSLDILELMFQLGIETDDVLDDDTFVESLDTMTLGELYQLLTTAGTSEPSSPEVTVQ